MTISADTWQARAAMCELLALSLRYPKDAVLSEKVASGEWHDAADEIAGALALAWSADETAAADGGAAAPSDPTELQRALRVEATRLFVGSPEPACSPFEGVWRAADDGVQALLFVNPHSMAVERFCKACGLGRPEGTNEPLDAVATELELLEYLALRAAVDVAEAEGDALGEPEDAVEAEGDAGDVVASADLPGGSPEAAWDQFMADHAKAWMPRFAEALQKESRIPFYRQVARLLGAFIG
ncbi:MULTISPECIES: molecular chaperone [unclassified Adlercreutzia]|uniref:TorD/DmsD family molecular chaperone n=1 Tax=unclassified Adlercreutzia TaxID=2636013 RepID=UPI001F14A9EA|nr:MULTISPECIES: molecular chaperone TorD family protein [unclassified Adlercreutzia]